MGGLYLAYEGAEKIIEFLFHRKKKEIQEEPAKVNEEDAAAEQKKIKSAITTDFILSIEIVIIALGTVLNQPLTIQIITVSVVAVLATVGVYGLVALIVRMDDAGFRLIKGSRNKGVFAAIGRLLVISLPAIIKFFSVVGTIALLMVSGGIFVHNIDFFHHLLPSWNSTLKEMVIAFGIGLLAVAVLAVVKKILLLFKK
ncbi:DUF808 domain-containing protein [Sphingobacterium sp. T2]|uniref:DUF808 domain-containing protein n=1 Tax=Sphingobacterium sp. T2 TaxID=1590596 RepID=UPI000AA9EFF7|nr:DUF808 domain-containing protein [Sphingobacterium sp. T2]